jgi:hypothetical protein
LLGGIHAEDLSEIQNLRSAGFTVSTATLGQVLRDVGHRHLVLEEADEFEADELKSGFEFGRFRETMRYEARNVVSILHVADPFGFKEVFLIGRVH